MTVFARDNIKIGFLWLLILNREYPTMWVNLMLQAHPPPLPLCPYAGYHYKHHFTDRQTKTLTSVQDFSRLCRACCKAAWVCLTNRICGTRKCVNPGNYRNYNVPQKQKQTCAGMLKHDSQGYRSVCGVKLFCIQTIWDVRASGVGGYA